MTKDEGFKIAKDISGELKQLYNKRNRTEKDELNIQTLKEGLDEIMDADETNEIRNWVNSSSDKIIRDDLDDDLQNRGAWGSYDKPYSKSNSIIGATNDRSFRGMFRESLSRDGWKNFDEFITAIHNVLSDPKLTRALQSGVPSDGGFCIPDQFASEIFDSALESEIVRPRASVYPMKSDTKKIPGIEISDHTQNIFGGIIAYWKGEGVELSEKSPKFRLMELTAKKLTCLTRSSNELVEDGIGMADQVPQMIINAVSWYLDESFLTGSGAGQPLGILNSGSLVTVPKETGQKSGTIVYQNLINMFSRIYPQGMKNSVWVASQSCLPQLLSLTQIVGTGGSAIPIMREDKNGGYSILTRPVIITEKLKTVGTVGDILFCDLSQYAIGLRKDLRLDRSGHVYFTSDQEAWRCIVRVDGQPLWDNFLTLKDSTTVSPFIALQSRT